MLHLEPDAVTGDAGMAVTEWAPVGLVGAITPTANPTSTIINNTISILSAGNDVVFNVHPSAKKCSAENVRLLNRAIVAAGGPHDLVTAIGVPTLESAKALMNHLDVRALLVTGGPGVVEEALSSTKRAVTAGPGNPPAVVDETADLARAIVAGASFDNNLICTDEKEAIVIESVADQLLREMAKAGAYVLKEHELKRLERAIFEEMGPRNKPGVINGAFIGKNASVILNEIGVQVGDDVRLVIADVPNEHNLVWTEQMIPVFPVFPVTRVPNVDVGIELAVRAEHGFRHTAGIHSTNVEAIARMARAMNCSTFVANGSFFAGLGQGGEGYSSFSIASPSGDGMTRPRTFSRPRRVSVVGALRIV